MEIKKTIIEKFLNLVRKTPIISGLPDINSDDFIESVRETMVTIIISTMPIWVGAFVLASVDGNISPSFYWGGILELTKKGELILYSSSLLSPVLYVLLVDKPNYKRFPSRISHFLIVFVILVIAAVFYAMSLVNEHDIDNTRIFAFIVFVISVSLLVVSQAYKNYMADPAGKFKESEADFSSGYKNHRGA
ncbi:hypothetical protein [Neptuniibacter sp. CAU 1671]|uniref:hypothetical protein n=1 Tax=Neptuniibacter sp. CAU 1671 TaxID=3032593 RepID=UPI0023DC7EAA|nr:hypothetical protein [Neptuniibacter sp. CAU 1671]MDF2180968.1 hypothetical protein [Neptuniibacter sp. CAU 1671]